MRLQILVCVTLGPVLSVLAAVTNAADPKPLPAPPVPAAGAAGAPVAGLPPEKIDELVAPIALYPDVLISQILPASTFPVDIVKAARWLRTKPDMSTLPKQEWDLSVLSLCHYPDVIYKMDQDLDWTSALGATFMAQPKDVMDAVQRLRLRAQQCGSLKTTEQQTVVIEKETVRIVPSQPEVIYVPTYNPQTVYVVKEDNSSNAAAAAVAGAAIGFGVGLAMGTWLDNDCDWHGGGVVYCKPGYWGGYRYRGAVAWNDNWAAAVGPRRAAVVGEQGGAYVGSRGAAVWGDNGHGAAWRRPTPYGAPTYGGRYSSYNSYRGNTAYRGNTYAGNTAYRGNTAVGNDVTINRNNVNVDRGDRNTAIRGGDQNTAIRGNTNVGVGGDRTNVARPGGSEAAAQRRSAGGPTQYPSNNASGRSPDRSGTGGARPGSAGSTARPGSASSSGRSAFSNYSGSSQTRSYSNRGSSSRGSGGISRGGGASRGGGGGRGRR